MKSGRYVKVAENMPNYLSDFSWEWEDRSQKSTGKERREGAPEKCKVYKYPSQNPQFQVKKEIMGKTKEGCRRTGYFRSFHWFGVFAGETPAKGATGRRNTAAYTVHRHLAASQLHQISWGKGSQRGPQFCCFCCTSFSETVRETILRLETISSE